jgi:TPR repeat protein
MVDDDPDFWEDSQNDKYFSFGEDSEPSTRHHRRQVLRYVVTKKQQTILLRWCRRLRVAATPLLQPQNATFESEEIYIEDRSRDFGGGKYDVYFGPEILPQSSPGTERIGRILDAALEGDIESQYQMALLFREGNMLEKSEAFAFCLAWRAAARGHVRSMAFVAACHWSAWGVPLNYELGVHYYRRAAVHHYSPAEYMLGVSYFSGNGVPIHAVSALRWLGRAVRRGHGGAAELMGRIYSEGKLTATRPERAFKWWLRGALLGNPKSMLQVADCYFYARGVEYDYGRYLHWIEKLAQTNDETGLRRWSYANETVYVDFDEQMHLGLPLTENSRTLFLRRSTWVKVKTQDQLPVTEIIADQNHYLQTKGIYDSHLAHSCREAIGRFGRMRDWDEINSGSLH